METKDVEIVLQRALDTLPKHTPRPRIISDNGSQYVSWAIQIIPQRNRLRPFQSPRSTPAIKRENRTMAQKHKNRMRTKTALADLDEARIVIAAYVTNYNQVRLHNAIHYLTPAEALKGHDHIATKLAQRKAAFDDADKKQRAYWTAKKSV